MAWNVQHYMSNPNQPPTTRSQERVGNYHPTFKGNEQQDSQEFLGFLLDSMHEDLNVARRQPHPRIKEVGEEDEERLPDEILMEKSWERYKQLNWSIVVDMFQGVLKSRLECLSCGKVMIGMFLVVMFQKLFG